ncbi:hypothetical protein FACS1894141_5420 [Spirochaetia bacterium]|nr:hypothetical protein FACS1894141_5420 [Spirochaetia bacterium]
MKIRSGKTGDMIIALICFGIMLLCFLPMLNLLARSLSSPQAIVNRRVTFWPVQTTLESYRYVFLDKAFSRSMIWTAILTLIYTLISLGMTILCAFPLIYSKLKGKKAINTYIGQGGQGRMASPEGIGLIPLLYHLITHCPAPPPSFNSA